MKSGVRDRWQAFLAGVTSLSIGGPAYPELIDVDRRGSVAKALVQDRKRINGYFGVAIGKVEADLKHEPVPSSPSVGKPIKFVASDLKPGEATIPQAAKVSKDVAS